ncbi:SMC family ATPase [Bifidobacterium sp. 82T24]|uniref:AAA family ATPase n=1 Tax=Bifidobacterium pluvialisilvae TaxID=2834436 RepID=UPI001C560D4B|nr:SMC family ATPase [Bifidobacterium pluvialisilvae]MBW3088995.1 SMC family ATPase [Bifidobacterium pluvialisilvae]
MRLIGMRFMGIGPYENEYSIDFAALNRSHIFLIEGETGSGKSTILDCISFALYGAVSVDDASKDRLRSRFLDTQQTPSFVDLIFEIDGAYYRVRRQPQYDRQKLRGTGTVTVNAKGALWKLDAGFADLVRRTRAGADGGDGSADRYFDYAEAGGHGEALATQARDTGAEIIRLLHLNRDQFSKTVMLAQGQFSGFLKCKPEERTKLIKDLFSADIYEQIQKILDDMRKKRSADVDARRRNAVGAIVEAKDNAERIAELAVQCGVADDETNDGDEADDIDDSIDVDGDDVDNADTPGDNVGDETDAAGADDDNISGDDAAWCLTDDGDLAEPAMGADDIVATIGERLRQTNETSDAVLRHCGDTVRTAASDLAVARERLDTVQRLRSLAADERTAAERNDRLAARAEEMRKNRDRLERSRKAGPVVQAQRECAALSVQRGKQERRLEECKEQLARYDSAETMTEAREAALRKAAERPVAEAALDSARTLRERIGKADAARKQAETAVAAVSQRERQVTAAAAALAALETSEAVNEQLQDVIRQEAAAAQLNERLDEANNRLDHARRRDTAERKLHELEDAALLAGRGHHEAEAAYKRAQAAYRAAGAAAFARLLEDGHPCPVCGALEHPTPTVAPADAPDETRLDQFDTAVSDALKAFEAAKSSVLVQRKTIETESALAGGLSVEQAQSAVNELQQRITESEALADRHKALAERLFAIRDAEQADTQARQQLEIARNNAENARRLADAAAELCLDDTTGRPVTLDVVELREQQAQQAIDECERQRTIADRLGDRLDQRATWERQTAEAEATLRTLGKQFATAIANRDRLAAANGFADVDEARLSMLPEQEATRLQQILDDYDAQVSIAEADLTRIRRELDGLARTPVAERLLGEGAHDATVGPGAEPGTGHDAADAPTTTDRAGFLAAIAALDETAAADRVAAAEQTHETAIRMEEQARSLDDTRRRRAATLATQLRDWAKASADYAPVRDMALLAGGKAGSLANDGLSLVTYAVTERFRDVLDRANEILKDIRGGVYELRLGTHEGRAAKTGLPIEVFDRRSEQSTEATTLSGGETFFVSLALSLALADIIQAENGGISMDTLFIDEGFGSLSDDYLDDVLAVLRSISRTRDIGVISHVGRLKDQIAERISVTRINEDSASRLTVTV